MEVFGPGKRLNGLKMSRKSDWSSVQRCSYIHTEPDSAQPDSELKECFPVTPEAQFNWIYLI